MLPDDTDQTCAPEAGSPHGPSADPVVVCRDATYAPRGGYRSFEFASFEAAPGAVTALLSADPACARDLGLAVAGLVRPTSGSLRVRGVELARARSRGARLPRGSVGIGFVTGAAEVDGTLTVEEAVARELAWRGAADADVLVYLGEHGLATHADRRLDLLDARSRARLSGALALAAAPAVAVVDLGDPFVQGLSARDAELTVSAWRRVARARGCAVIACTPEPAAARAADAAVALDIPSAEALAAPRPSRPEEARS